MRVCREQALEGLLGFGDAALLQQGLGVTC
jgi:hypothetical protein